jgi:hypothetical protein
MAIGCLVISLGFAKLLDKNSNQKKIQKHCGVYQGVTIEFSIPSAFIHWLLGGTKLALICRRLGPVTLLFHMCFWFASLFIYFC